jgi:DNA-binding IclR family transcriptional regulator
MLQKSQPKRPGRGDGARTPPLERYIRALEAVAATPNGLTLGDLAERCQLPAGTAHRLVNVLLDLELLKNSAQNQRVFVVAERLQRLVHGGTAKGYLKIAVQPVLDRLATRLENTCFLARLSGHAVESIAWAVPTGGSMRGLLLPEQVMPPHASASAKAILAFQRPALIEEALSGDLPKLSEATLTKVDQVRAEYDKVRRQGYATCWGEMELGLAAVACPLAVPELGVIYSVATSGLMERIKRRETIETVEILQEVTHELAGVLAAAHAAGREADRR